MFLRFTLKVVLPFTLWAWFTVTILGVAARLLNASSNWKVALGTFLILDLGVANLVCLPWYANRLEKGL